MHTEPLYQDRLALFPISFFSITLGLGGWAIATQKITSTLSLPAWVSTATLALDVLVFTLLVIFYVLKLFVHTDAVSRELGNPVKLSFFPTISIGIILMGIAFLDINFPISRFLWATGTALHLAFTLYIIKDWIWQEHYEIHHMNPAWFIPVVGNILVPIAGVSHAPEDLSWFFFSVGIVFWITLFAIVMYRIFLHRSISERLLPTLFILIAPPAVGFIAYVKLTDSLDAFARVLYFFALFLLLLLFTVFNRFRRIRFYLSWWAYSFPVAAFTIASVLMGRMSGTPIYFGLAAVLWCFLSLLITLLALKTVVAIAGHEICVDE
ncbi:MAG: SLAC1 anion channel family protein [Syntrophaceae bacterium]|nr:SLAC1 anion channel family protein [Syntrophaceae bacterium]